MTDLIPAARPVPSPEDRMRDARTDREYADRIPAPRPLTTDRTNGQTRAVRELLADLTDAGNTIDAAQAALSRAGITNPAAEVGDLIGELAAQRDEAQQAFDLIRDDRDRLRDERDHARQTAGFRQGVIDRHRQELGAAGEVLAVVRDAAERIDRALAVYDTTPEEPAEREGAPHEDPSRLREQLAEAHADCARYATERDQARAELEQLRPKLAHLEEIRATYDAARDGLSRYRDAITAENTQWQAEVAHLRSLIAGQHDWQTIPVQDIRKALRDGPPPSSVPPRRAQEHPVELAARELHADNYRDRDATTDAHAADMWPRLLDVERAQWIAKAERVLRAAGCS